MLKQVAEQQERKAENVVVPKSKKQQLTFPVTPSCLCFRHDIANKTKDFNERLLVIDEQRRNTHVFQRNEDGIQQVPKRQETYNKYLNGKRLLPMSDISKVLLNDGRENKIADRKR
ncbi:hypothetical protein C1H46_009164 [Malus baccata]|uniref:Uncharacterized protein n=1 Tax=Malus baccata TaxID=106549 RepID=A0A540N2C5_MALBA|nr:hypothetical protein C1H46_009164 [Malus baccata]